MKSLDQKRIVTSCFLLILSFLISCSQKINPTLKVEKGFLNLENYDFSKGAVQLHGEWEFVWEKFLVSEKTESKEISEKEFIELPSTWKGKIHHGQTLSGHGFATYRMQVVLPSKNRAYGISIPSVETAYRLYQNGELIASTGQIGKSKETSIPLWKTKLAFFEPTTEALELVLEVSNFHHAREGYSGSLILADFETIQKLQDFQLGFDLFMVGAVGIIAAYHLILYLLRRKDRSPLFFSYFCLAVLIRVISVNERVIYSAFPNLSFEFVAKLEYLGFILPGPIFILFFVFLFKDVFLKKALVSLSIFNFLFVPVILFSSLDIYSHLATVLYLLIVFSAILISISMVHLSLQKSAGGIITTSAWVIFLATVLNDILHASYVIDTAYIFPFGVFIFIFSQSYLIAIRNAEAFHRVEVLSESLEVLNEQLEDRIEERTKELNGIVQTLKSDNMTARELQRSLLPKDLIETTHYKIHSIFTPVEDVGGDVFSIHKEENGIVTIMLADATGHGVQAGLFTMAIYSEFENVNSIQKPISYILEELNENFIRKYHKVEAFFTTIIIRLHPNKIEYGFAGQPEQILLRGDTSQSFSEKGRLIGFKRGLRFFDNSLELLPQDRILLFTDGLFENYKTDGIAYGDEALRKTAEEYKDLELKEFSNQVVESMREKSFDGIFADDVTLICIEKKS